MAARSRLHRLVLLVAFLVFAASPLVIAEDSNTDSEHGRRLKRLLQRAPEADANKDGKLTMEEARAYLQAQREKRDPNDRSNASKRSAGNRPKPTHANVPYGDHQRHVIDLYLVDDGKAKKPTPLLIYIHGGGFVGGSKNGAAGYVKVMHAAGISVAGIHYRFIGDQHTFPVPFHDAARALQFLRHHAKKYNLDGKRFACAGGSAGAGISLWLANHDDLADPKAKDPIARQSTRILAASVGGAQVSYNPIFWKKLGLERGVNHPSFSKMFGVSVGAGKPFDDPKKIALANECASIHHLTRDDPPIYFSYNVGKEINEKTGMGAVVHHPLHGLYYQERAKKLGVECHVMYRGGDRPKLSPMAFLIEQLTGKSAGDP